MNIETGHETCPGTRLYGVGLTVIPGGFPHGIDTFVSFGESTPCAGIPGRPVGLIWKIEFLILPVDGGG